MILYRHSVHDKELEERDGCTAAQRTCELTLQEGDDIIIYVDIRKDAFQHRIEHITLHKELGQTFGISTKDIVALFTRSLPIEMFVHRLTIGKRQDVLARLRTELHLTSQQRLLKDRHGINQLLRDIVQRKSQTLIALIANKLVVL